MTRAISQLLPNLIVSVIHFGFNGVRLSGWVEMNGSSNQTVPAGWCVVGSSPVRTGKPLLVGSFNCLTNVVIQ